jgi:MFS family permease
VIGSYVHLSGTNEDSSGKALAVTYEALLFSFVLPAAILLTINKDIGPSAQITWIATSWTLAGAVMQTIAGRCSDIFGRRNFFITGNLVAVIGKLMAFAQLLRLAANEFGGCTVACRCVAPIEY